MLRIGLTGGIGVGKTTVSDKFKLSYDIPVIDADEISRNLIQPGNATHTEIVNIFGEPCLTKGGDIDRAYLRQTVFSNQEKRKLLENIIHPKVRAEIDKKIQTLNSPYCIIVIPLLIESNMQSLVDRILVVDSSKENQIERVKIRDKCNTDHVESILNAQIDSHERLDHADDIITNNSELKDLDQQIHQLHEKYLEISR